MKRIALLAAALPVPAMAHGVHAPVADHAAAHMAAVLGLAVIVVASLVAAWRARG